MIKLKILESFYITGRGDVVVVELPDGLVNGDLKGLYMGKTMMYLDVPHKIVGIETMGCQDRSVSKCAFLLRKI